MTRGRALLTGVAAFILVGAAPAMAATDRADPVPEPTLAWQDFTQRSVDRWLALDPAFAVYQGAHQYDGQLPDWSAAGLKARRDFLRALIAEAKAYRALTGAQAFERDYLVQVAAGQLFWLEDADLPHTNPSFYINGGLDPNVYVTRDYADKPARMKAMIAFFEGVPKAARNIRANLRVPLPPSFVKYGVAGFGGFAEYYRGDARAAFADVQDAALQAQFATASEKAAAAMADLAAWLKTQGSSGKGFALGPAKFARMLKATEGVDTPLDELAAIGRADLARNQKALQQACADYAPGRPIPECLAKLKGDKPAEGPVAAATAQIPELTAFVRAKNLATIPGTEQALVRESPPYNRQNGAYIDPPGPYEKGIPSIYYISPPDPAWSPEKQREYIPDRTDLLFTSVHEVMPGHFLQFLHSNRSPSLIGRMFVGYAFTEGWAHYSEELMWEAGLGNRDPGVHIGQLSKALQRDCRFLSAIGLHARGMTQARSEAMFREQCHQGAGTAEQQAARGTYDPAYLNYTLGKLMIRRLRADWTASRGGRAAWKQFHDAFLSYGGPPIPLVRQAMMKEPAAHSAF